MNPTFREAGIPKSRKQRICLSLPLFLSREFVPSKPGRVGGQVIWFVHLAKQRVFDRGYGDDIRLNDLVVSFEM